MEQEKVSTGLPAGWRFTPDEPAIEEQQGQEASALPSGWRFTPTEPEEQKPYNFKEETWPAYAGRQVLRAGSRVAETIAGAPGQAYETLKSLPESAQMGLEQLLPASNLTAPLIKKAGSLIGEQLPTPESIKGHIAKLVPEKYFEPQNIVERGMDTLAEETPRIVADLITGGAAKTGRYAAKVASRITPGFVTKELGGGPLMQTIANLIGAGGFEAWAHRKSGMNLPKFAEDTELEQYNVAKKEAQKLYFPGESLEKGFNALAKDIKEGGTGMEDTAIKRIVKEINNVGKIVQKTGRRVGQVNLRRAIKQKRHVNQRIRDLSEKAGSKTEVEWLERINGAIREQIEPFEKSNPVFGKAYRRAETLAENIGTINETDEYINTLMKNPLFAKFKPGKIKRFFTWGTKRKPSRDVIHFFKNNKPELQEYAAKVFDAAMNRDEQGVKKYLDVLKGFGLDI